MSVEHIWFVIWQTLCTVLWWHSQCLQFAKKCPWTIKQWGDLIINVSICTKLDAHYLHDISIPNEFIVLFQACSSVFLVGVCLWIIRNLSHPSQMELFMLILMWRFLIFFQLMTRSSLSPCPCTSVFSGRRVGIPSSILFQFIHTYQLNLVDFLLILFVNQLYLSFSSVAIRT